MAAVDVPVVIGPRPPAGEPALVLVRSPIGDAGDIAAQRDACREACDRLGLVVGEVRELQRGDLDGADLAGEVPEGMRAVVVRDLRVVFGGDRCSLMAQDRHEMRVEAFLARARPRRTGLVLCEVSPADLESLAAYLPYQ